MDNISKEYFGNKVLKGVELHVAPGEIHALMGENGAGKSTLMNILFGMPVIHNTGGFGGTIEFDGQPVTIDSPQKAMELGIGMVHQEFMLIPGFTVTENVKLGREITTPTIASGVFGKRTDRDPVCCLNSDLCIFIKIDSLWVDVSLFDREVFPHDRLTYFTLVRLYIDSMRM